MTRKRSSRSRSRLRLQPWERLLFILGVTIYILGLFGGLSLLAMPLTTTVVLLAIGGGLQFLVTLSLVF